MEDLGYIQSSLYVRCYRCHLYRILGAYQESTNTTFNSYTDLDNNKHFFQQALPKKNQSVIFLNLTTSL